MLETVAGLPWEELLTRELFAPLGMTSAGFGVPATPRYLNQPWGHTLPAPASPPAANNPATPIEPATPADNPPAIGPAATVHCTLEDFARYIALHLNADKSDTPLLTRASAVKLHTAYPNNANYAHGWVVVGRPWGNGNVLTHDGSNNQWYTNVWFAPERGFGVISVCNLGGTTAANTADDIASAIINQFLQ
jgi:CubicO group peptidase (beta-lactamase class C family)